MPLLGSIERVSGRVPRLQNVMRRLTCGIRGVVCRQQPPVDFPRLYPVGEKVDPDDLIGAAEVQAILKLSHPSSVTTYLKRYPDFPAPVIDRSSSRVRLWKRQDIEQWLEAREGRS